MAKHIKSFSKLFSAEIINKHYVPIFFDLCLDEVAEVRKTATKAVKNILRKLKDNNELFDSFMKTANTFFLSPKYSDR